MHTGEGNTCTVHVSATLLMLGYLSIQGELQQMLAPFAGQRLFIDIGKGKPLQCRLNAAGDRIRSRKLADYIIDAGTLDFTATLRYGTLFLYPRIANELHIKLELQHRDRLLNIIVLYNPLAGRIEPPVCPVCRRPTTRLVPNRENRLVCADHG